MEGSRGLAVGELLVEPFLAGTVVAGTSGFEQRVTWALPLFTLADQGAVCAHAVVVVDRAAGVVDENGVRTLQRAGAALAVLTPGTTVDPAARRVAAGAGLTMLVLKEFRSTYDLVRAINGRILHSDMRILEYRTSAHRTIARTFASGAGLAALLRTMSSLGGASVLLLHSDGSLIESAGDEPAAAEVAAAIHEALQRSQAPAVAEHHFIVDLAWEDAHGPRTALATRLVIVGGGTRWLALVPREAFPQEQQTQLRRIVLEEGSALTVAELLRLRTALETEERSRNDFASALLFERFRDERERQSRCEFFQVNLEVPHTVIVAETYSDEPTKGAFQRAGLARLVRQLDARVTGRKPSVLAVLGSVIVVIKESDGGRPTAKDAASPDDHRYATALLQHLTDTGTGQVVAVGDPHPGASGIAQSYREARLADAYARRTQTTGVAHFAALIALAAIAEAARSDAGRDFAARVLGPLNRAEDRAELDQVITAYFEESGNLNAAARRLHVHRNTLLYKLDRASRILGLNVRQLDALFTVWLAREIESVFTTQSALLRENAPVEP